MTFVTYFVLALVLSASENEGSRILAVFPTPSISHQVVFRPLVQELVKRGHEVTVVTTDPAFAKGEAPANLTEVDVHDMSYKLWREHFLATSTGNKNDLRTQMRVAFELFTKIFGSQMETKEVQDIIKHGKFDLLMVEALVRPAISLSHIFKVPVIQVSSFGATYWNWDVVGAPVHPFLYPSMFRQRIMNLTIWEKISELYNHYTFKNLAHSVEERENQMIRRIFGEDMPSLTELSNNVDMLFVNMHPIWEGNRPVPPSVLFMGGLHQKPVKELPKELKSYLDASTKGVIYISFGTNVNPSQLPPEKIQILAKVFSELPYNVLWKWDKDVLPGQSGNIRISKWLPQSDLLRHPNIKLFITQGGLQSTDEAITAGVPLIGMPMLGDQWFNVEKYVYHKIGMRVDMETLTEERFKEAVEKIIGDESYRQNIKRLGVLMRDQPQPPLQRAVWWTEHVIRHSGARHLRATSANMSWYEYLEMDVVLTLVTILVAGISFIVVILKFVAKNFMVDVKVKSS
ncbi:UDP-glucuronosyltransferase 2B20-like [Ostrinia furnacalis]|uniref:UDP-glucuronosyltransferase 2B20-like n=1 Tax=Ostrinia furnacalis TaxID=93504 RepID=UPI00103DA364|nr:UDP-glucuronosyltransferase 2B20-like [Ostrinia furnacalis]